jgi:glycogen operon protein
VVVHDAFPWGDDRRPGVPWADTIIYEAHVRGFTMRHPDVPPHQRGSFAAMGSAPVIDHLQQLGITTLELLPVHHFVAEHALIARKLTNYWGYNSIGFFAPEARYSSTGSRGEQVTEFKAMVRNLHKAGIEVILDVVYNHTAEGDHLGPTLAFRGLDNRSYYRTFNQNPRFYREDYTGCGNTLNVRHPQVLALIMDSLRYWVEEMHVDGFRFDLATTLARSFHEVDRLSAFFDLIHQDPLISGVKLIAEPWDVGRGRLPGRQLPGAVDRVERPLPRHHARLLARRPRRQGRLPCPADRQLRPVPARRPPPLGQHQLRHRPRRLHLAGPGQLQRQVQPGQRLGQR